jgi:hypothetical protein
LSATRCSSITVHASPTTRSGAACRRSSRPVSSPRPGPSGLRAQLL